jgi:prolyl 4-hydroxylase
LQSAAGHMRFAALATDLQAWLRQCVAKGFSRDAIEQSLRATGYQREFARRAAAAAFEALGGHKPAIAASVPAPAAPPMGDAPADRDLPAPHGTSSQILAAAANSIEAGDRNVHILLALNSPRIVLFGDLLAPEECEALIEMSKGKLARSNVVNRQTGQYDVHPDRTSEGMYFQRGENELVARIEQRIAELTSCPVERGEPIQVLRYQPGGQYKPHFDYFDPSHAGNQQVLAMGGQRIATLLMYLNDVQAGGSTIFPEIGLDVLPRRGHAVFFAYADQEGRLDARTLHGGSPVSAGEKWIATKWLRQNDYCDLRR